MTVYVSTRLFIYLTQEASEVHIHLESFFVFFKYQKGTPSFVIIMNSIVSFIIIIITTKQTLNRIYYNDIYR